MPRYVVTFEKLIIEQGACTVEADSPAEAIEKGNVVHRGEAVDADGCGVEWDRTSQETQQEYQHQVELESELLERLDQPCD